MLSSYPTKFECNPSSHTQIILHGVSDALAPVLSVVSKNTPKGKMVNRGR